MALYQGDGRPVKPAWMHATRNQRRSWDYWNTIYQAMPPWVDQKIVAELRDIYLGCPDGHHVDHIVPLRGVIVLGLHLPCNLQYLTVAGNYHKSNNYWPDMPFQQLELIL